MRRAIALILAAVLLIGGVMIVRHLNRPAPVDGGSAVGLSGNMWRMPVTLPEDAQTRQLLADEDALLRVDRDGTLTLLSQEDFSVLAQTETEIRERTYVQLLENGVSIADPETGTVTLLDPALEVSAVHTPGPSGELWMLSPDGGTLYGFSEEGLTARPVSGGAAQQVLEQGSYLGLYAYTPGAMTLMQIGPDLRERWYRLELGTGELTELGETASAAAANRLLPLEDGRYLYRNGRAVTVYESDGTFLCYGMFSLLNDPPETPVASDLVWSDQRQGYFFIDHPEDGEQLIFLDPSTGMDGIDMKLTEEPAPEGTVLPQELYERAAALSARFRVDLRIADQCQLDYNTFRSKSFQDPQKVSEALDILEQALEKYPDGYLEQLKYGSIRRIRIELVADLRPDADADVSSTAAAFSRERKREYLIVLDGDVLKETNLHHELAHVADKRIAMSCALREDALFREEEWMALQPEGFVYADSYRDISDDVTAFYGSGYFARDYACVSASEDKATMMETAIMGRADIYGRNPHLLPKLAYYCACIRDSFDDSGWPETVVWEQLLGQASD